MASDTIPASTRPCVISIFEQSTGLTDTERTKLAKIAQILAGAPMKKKAPGPDIARPMNETEIRFIEAHRDHSEEFLEAMLALFEGEALPVAATTD